jgi:hypothetical protein
MNAALSAETIFQIIGPLGEPYELALLAAADRRAAGLVTERQGVLLEDAHYTAIDAIANEVTGEKSSDTLEHLLQEFDGLIRDGEVLDAHTVACNFWTPKVGASFYLGLAIGLRLAAARPTGGAR